MLVKPLEGLKEQKLEGCPQTSRSDHIATVKKPRNHRDHCQYRSYFSPMELMAIETQKVLPLKITSNVAPISTTDRENRQAMKMASIWFLPSKFHVILYLIGKICTESYQHGSLRSIVVGFFNYKLILLKLNIQKNVQIIIRQLGEFS